METPQVVDVSPKETAVGITVSTTHQEQHINIVLQTWIGRDDPESSFHGLMDRLSRVIERQRAFYRRKDLILGVKHEKKFLEFQVEDFNRIDGRSQEAWERSGKKGVHSLSPQEEQQKEVTKINIKKYKDSIIKMENEIKECEEILNAPASAADMQSG